MTFMGAGRQQLRVLTFDVTLMVVAGFVPAIILGLLGWSNGVTVAILAGLAVFIACMGGSGWRTGLVISAPFAILLALGDWAAPNPWLAAAVLGVAAFVRGYAAKVGMHDALMMTIIALGFIVASPVPSNTPIPSPLYVALVALGASLWATLVMYLLRNRLKGRAHTALDPIHVLSFSVVLALLVAVATWFVVDLDLGHTGGWIILTILVVFQPSLGAGFTKAAHRAAGTVLGFVIALIVGSIVPAGVLLYLVGFLLLMGAFLLLLEGRPYWLYATLLTPAIVLLESAGSTLDLVDEERLGATLVGVGLSVLVMLVLAPLAQVWNSRMAAVDAAGPDVSKKGTANSPGRN